VIVLPSVLALFHTLQLQQCINTGASNTHNLLLVADHARAYMHVRMQHTLQTHCLLSSTAAAAAAAVAVGLNSKPFDAEASRATFQTAYYN
jgi:mevalonate pyrophosphate decarboxylase